MAEENLVTNIVARSNFSDLIADLNRVSSRLTTLQSQLNVTNKALALQAAQMQASFAATMRSTGQFATHFVSLSSDVDKFGRNLDSGKMKLGQYYRAWNDHAKTAGGLVRDLAKQQVMMQNAILQPLGRNAQGLMQFNVHVPQGLDTIKNKTAIARQEMMIMNKVIQDGANQVINWGKNTQWAGRQLTMGLTLPIAAFGAAAAKAFREADQELVRLTKVYGGIAATSAADLQRIRTEVSATAKELSSSYGASYRETIALAADLAATGQQGNDLLRSTQETTRLSILGEVDRQEAMKATLAIQNAFKQNTDQLAESINFLNAVENQTSTSLQDLVEAIPKAGPVVKALGGDVQDLALYLTAMREGGINASEGANALKSALASIINPTKVARDMFKGFGIDIGAIVTGNAGDLTATILELQGALDQLDPLKKSQAIEQLFGKFQFARMNALFANLGKQGSQTLQVLDLMKASSKDLENIATRELSMVTESASGKYRRAIETLKAEMAGVGDQFLMVGTKILNVVNGVLQFFNKMPDPLKAVIGFVGGLTALAGPVIMLTGLLANFFGYIVKGVFHFKSLIKGGEGFKLLTPEIMAAEKAGNLLEKSFYNDAKASAVLKQAISNLTAELSLLETKANSARVSVGPAIQTVAGSVVAPGQTGGVRVDPSNPLVGAPYSRQFAHLIPSGTAQQGSIFGVVPNPGPVNVRIGKNAQYYADERMPNIEGVTSIRGVSGGIVAQEAAKWHSMTAALAMQSKAEIADLKREVAATGNITASLSSSYSALLPQMTMVTSLAADEAKLIVEQLKSGKITVDVARSKIIALNATVEAMIAETAAQVAATQGRTISLNTVPLTGQPAVDPITGKSNMKELFHKGPTASLVDRIARVLGVRTSGAGYSTQTVKFGKFDKGGRIEKFGPGKTRVSGPSSIKYDDRFGEVPLDGYVLNQRASLDPKNKALIEAAPSTYSTNASTTYAALTPKEVVYGPGIMKDPELYAAVEAANNGYNFGGQIKAGIRGYGPMPPSARLLALQRMIAAQAKSTYARTVLADYASGVRASSGVIRGPAQDMMAMFGKSPTASQSFNEAGQLITVRAGKETITPGLIAKPATGLYGGADFASLNKLLSGKGVTGSDVKRLIRDYLSGGDGKTVFGSTSQFTDAISKHGIITEQVSAQIRKEINSAFIRELMRMKRAGTAITDANNPYHAISASVIGKHAADNPNLANLWEQWIRKTSALNSHTLNEMNRGAGAASNGVINLVLSNPAGGIGIGVGQLKGTKERPFYHSVNPDWENKYLKTHGVERLTAKWPEKETSYPMGHQYAVNNTDPVHGPLQIGRAMGLLPKGAPKREDTDPFLMPRQVYYSDRFGRLSIDEQFLSGTLRERGMYATSQYMSGNKAIMKMMQDIPTSHPLGPIAAMKTLQSKFTGRLYRGLILGKTHNPIPDDIAKAIIEAKRTGVYDDLLGKEFIMRRSSWSKDRDVARFFAPGRNVDPESVLFEAMVRNRNILPAGDLFPKKTFQAPYGQDWGSGRFGTGYKSEQEAIFGGKFRIVDVKDGVVKLETVFEPREMGGPVNAGQPYVVGEKGPEIFIPKNSGEIIPNNAIPKFDGGGNTRGSGTRGSRFTHQSSVDRGTWWRSTHDLPTNSIMQMQMRLRDQMSMMAGQYVNIGARAIYAVDRAMYRFDGALSKAGTTISDIAGRTAGVISGAFGRLGSAIGMGGSTVAAAGTGATLGGIRGVPGLGERYLGGLGPRKMLMDQVPLGMGAGGVRLDDQGNKVGGRASGAFGTQYRRSLYKLSGSGMSRMMPKDGFKAGGMGTWMGGSIAGGAIGGALGGATGTMVGSLALPMGIMAISTASQKAAAAGTTLMSVLAGSAGAAAPFIAIAAAIAAVGFAAYKYKQRIEDIGQANRAVFGASDKALKEVGLTYKSNTDRLKELNEQLAINRASGLAAYKQNTKVGGAIGLNLSIDQLQKGIEDAKKNAKETISNINNVGERDDVVRLAASMKQQYISAGMSVQDATNKVYTLIKASDKAAYAFTAITSKAFNSITDQGTAAQYAINNLVSEMKKGSVNAEEMAVGIDNMLISLNSYTNSLVGTKDENGKILDVQDAQQLALSKITKTTGAWKNVSEDVLNQIKSQDLILGAVLSKNESLVSIYAKQALVQGGYSDKMDIFSLSEKDAVLAARGLSVYQDKVAEVVTSTDGPLGGLSTTYNDLTKAIKTATNAAKGLNNTTDYNKIIKNQTALIKKIKEEADARIKALNVQKASSNFNTELQKEQLAYQAALASGDMTAAAQSQLNIRSLTSDRQNELAVQAIQDAADKKIKSAEAKITAAQNAMEKKQLEAQAAQTSASNNMAQQAAIGNFQSTVSRLASSFVDVKDLSESDRKSLTGQMRTAISDLMAAGGIAAQKGKTILEPYSKQGPTPEIAFLDAINFKGEQDAKASGFAPAVNVFLDAVNAFSTAVAGFDPNAKEGTLKNPSKLTGADVASAIEARNAKYPNASKLTLEQFYNEDGKTLSNKGRKVLMEMGFVDPSQVFQLNGRIYQMKKSGFIAGTNYTESIDGTNYQIVQHKGKAMGGAIPGYADGGSYSPGMGGYIRGAGTPTSDSIVLPVGNGGIIRASDTEFMQPASSVSYYGKDFMEDLRARRIPKEIISAAMGGAIPGYPMGGAIKGYKDGGSVKDGWLQKWARSISGQPGSEMLGTAPLLRLLAGIGGKGDKLGASMVPLSFAGMGVGSKIARSGGLMRALFAVPNKINQVRNQAKVNAMIKGGMWHGSQPQGLRGEEYLQGTNILDGAETYDPYYGMGFFGTSSKSEADLYASGYNSSSNWGASFGSMNSIVSAPRGKYVDFTRGTNSLKWQDYALAKALGVKKNGYIGEYMPENLGDIMSGEGMTGAIMKRINAGMVPGDIQNANWLAWNNPAGVITKEKYAMGGAIPGYKDGGILSGIGSFFKNTFGLDNPFKSREQHARESAAAKAKLKEQGWGKYLLGTTGESLMQSLAWMGPASGLAKNYASRMAATKLSPVSQMVTERQGIEVIDRTLPKFVNKMMQVTGIKTPELRKLDQLLTGYQETIKIAAQAEPSRLLPAIVPGKGVLNVFGNAQWDLRTAWKDGTGLGKIKDVLRVMNGNPVEDNAPYAMRASGDIFMPKKTSTQTVFHELGHRDLNNMSLAAKTILGAKAWNPSAGTHEIYADRFSLAAKKVISKYWDEDWAAKHFANPFAKGESYVTNAGLGISEDFVHFVKGIQTGRSHQVTPRFLTDYLESSGSALSREAVDRIKIFKATLSRYEKQFSDPLSYMHGMLPKFEEIIKNAAPKLSMGGMIPKFHDGGQVHTTFAGGETMALLQDKERVLTPQQWDILNSKNSSGGDRIYQIAPVINASEGMDVHALADIATRKTLDAIKTMQYNERRSSGEGRLMT
jgi:TP901 family phage tail tape measure protein